MTTKNEDLLRRYINEAYPVGAVCKLFDDILAAKDAEKEEAVKAERERIKKELAISWDKSIESGSHWDLGDALLVVSVPLTPPTNQ